MSSCLETPPKTFSWKIGYICFILSFRSLTQREREKEGRKERGYEVNQVEQKNNACHARACMRGREGERRERGLLWFHCIDLFFHRKRISVYGVVFLQSAWSSACRSGNGMWRQAWSMCMLIPNLMTVCDTRAAVTLGTLYNDHVWWMHQHYLFFLNTLCFQRVRTFTKLMHVCVWIFDINGWMFVVCVRARSPLVCVYTQSYLYLHIYTQSYLPCRGTQPAPCPEIQLLLILVTLPTDNSLPKPATTR